MRKKVLMVFLTAALILTATACSPSGTSSGTQPNTSATSSAKETEKTTTTPTEKPTEKKGVSATQNNGDIEITLPASLMGDSATDKLTDEQKDNGFTAAKVNTDGSVTYTMKKSSYDKFIKDLKDTTAKSLKQVISAGTYKSLKTIEYNDDFSEITIKADAEKYEANQLDSMAIFGVGVAGALYQAYDVNIKTPSCTVNIVDDATGEVLNTGTYPQKQ